MIADTLKSYFFNAFLQWGEEYNQDVYFDFYTQGKSTILPEKFKKNKKVKLKISKKTCLDLKIHTNGITFYVYINKKKEDIFIPQTEWISLTSGEQFLDLNTLGSNTSPIKEKQKETPEISHPAFSKIHLIWDADKQVKNESVNKGL